MRKLWEMRPVDADYASTGPNQRTRVQPIGKPAAAVFRILEDGPSWKVWFNLGVAWTSERPFGVGTTRTVTGAGGLRIDEHFVAWEDGRRMAFRFDRASVPFEAFAEDWSVRPTSDDACELVWSYAYRWAGPRPVAAVADRTFGVAFGWQGKRALHKLATYAEGTDRFD